MYKYITAHNLLHLVSNVNIVKILGSPILYFLSIMNFIYHIYMSHNTDCYLKIKIYTVQM